MQLSFRLDKRPGESHLALDGKKRQANRELLATNSKKDRSWLQTRSQNLISKMKPFLASPDLPEIETKKMASVERDTNCPNRKEMPRRHPHPSECAQQPFYRCCGKMTSPGAAEFYLVYGEFHHHTWSW